MTKILKRPLALEDLDNIWFYIARDNPVEADNLIDIFDEKLQLIAEYPEIGPARSRYGQDIRVYPVGEYVIFYRPLREDIEVTRVLNAAQDLDAIFEEE